MLDAIDELVNVVCDPAEQFLKEAVAQSVVSPEFSLIFCAQGLAVFEARSNHAFVIPRGTSSWLSYLHDTFYPQWAANVVEGEASAGAASHK